MIRKQERLPERVSTLVRWRMYAAQFSDGRLALGKQERARAISVWVTIEKLERTK